MEMQKKHERIDDIERQAFITGISKYAKAKDIIRDSINPIKPPLDIIGIIKRDNENYAFIMFNSSEDKKIFIEATNGKINKGKKIKVKNPFKTMKENEFEILSKDIKIEKIIPQPDISKSVKSIEEQVTPLYFMKYSEQILYKKKIVEKILSDLQKSYEDPLASKLNIIDIENVIESPLEFQENYRNKTEFTIANDEFGQPIVGMVNSGLKKGLLVRNADGLKNISKEAKQVAFDLKELIKKNEFSVYDRNINKGFWRTLISRQSFKLKRLMLIIVVSKGENFEKVKEIICKKFNGDYSINDYKIYSINLVLSDCPNNDYNYNDEIICLYGQPFFVDMIGEYKFKISPFSFMQTNTIMCEKLYNQIKLWIDCENLTILDLYCGIGTIGISISNKAEKIIGIEIINSAVEDAKINAKENGIETKCSYHCAKVEDVIDKIVENLQGSKKLALLDPPRSGIHQDVLRCLRTCKGLNDMIYVSCNPQSLGKDLKYLCGEPLKRRKGPQFKIEKVAIVDMFPHTEHIETLVKLKRID